MGFNDVLKKSFVQATTESMSRGSAIAALAAACFIAVYIFFIYQSSVVISLGMVGALSIVRFRTAVKEPMDLVFLFWSISVGIICGAGLFEIAIFASLLITAAVLTLDHLPVSKTPMILIVDSSNIDGEEQIMETVEKYSAHSKVKSRNMNAESLNMVIEVRVKECAECIREINRLDGIRNVSMVSQEGEVTF